MATYEFHKEQRLLTAHDYDRVFKQAKHRVNSREFLMLASDRDASVSRLGTVVSKKAAGNAVERNRVRRLLKETFRLSALAPGVDVVVIARAAVRSQDNASLGKTLRKLWLDLERKRSA